jgi:hypothetical protein
MSRMLKVLLSGLMLLFMSETNAGLFSKDCVVDFNGYGEEGTVEGSLTKLMRAGYRRAREGKYDDGLYTPDETEALDWYAKNGPALEPQDCGAPMFAAAFGYVRLLEQLIDHKANLYASRFKHQGSHTPLTAAAFYGQLSIAKLLIERGAAKVDETNDAYWASYFVIFRDGGDTALNIAARNGHEDVVTYLLTKGASPHKASARGWTAIGWARSRRHDKIVAILEPFEKQAALK